MDTTTEAVKETPSTQPKPVLPQDAEFFAQALPVIGRLRQIGIIENDDRVERVVRQVAETNPELCFQNAGEFLQYPFAKEILLACAGKADKAAKAVFTYADQYKLKDFAADLFEIAANRLVESDPETLFKSCRYFLHMPFAHEILLKAAKCPEGNRGAVLPGSSFAFLYVDLYADQQYAEEVLLAAVDNNGAWNAFNYAKKYIDKPFAERVLLSAATKNMWAAIRFKEIYLSAPFSKRILLEIMGCLRLPPADEKKAKCPPGALQITIGNNTSIGYGDLISLIDCPFAEELFTELVQKSPEVFRELWRQYDWTLLNDWKSRQWIRNVVELAGITVDERKCA